MLFNCSAELTIDLKGERVRLISFEAEEFLGRPFVITIDVLSEGAEMDLLPCLGNEACVTIRQETEILRHFHGIITEGEALSDGMGGYMHRLTLRPHTHLMDHNSDYRIFQDKTAVEIILDVLSRNGITPKLNLKGHPAKRTYCVQYGESDFAFISRLMEEEGIYYFYEHRASDHAMMMVDSPTAHGDGDPDQLTFNPDIENMQVVMPDAHFGDSNYVFAWEERVSTGGEAKVTTRDYNFEMPKVLQIAAQIGPAHTQDTVEVYEFPGEYQQNADGEPLGKVRLEGLRARRQMFKGKSLTPALCYGTKFSLTDHPNDRYNRGFTLTRIHTQVYNSDYESGKEEDESFCEFEAILADHQWRSEPITEKPVVNGPETAVITGPEGEEIFTDKYGRVKVRFHWDRSGSKGEDSTCWMRVSQTGGLGNIILPRVGHEVIVDFLDGNPDRPLVVGRVFNGDHMPIYPLPDNKTRALWRTKRYGDTGDYGDAMDLDTGKPGVNELRFEDKGGHEEVFLHAERDMNTRVRHNETHHVGLDREIKIGGDETKDVVKNEVISIHKNSKLTVDEDNTVLIKGNKKVEIDKDETRTTKGNLKHDITGDRKITITGGDTTKVTGQSKSKAMSVEIEADTSITFKCGNSKIEMTPAGITVETMILQVKSSTLAKLESTIIQVNASAILQLKGAITMIN